MEKTKNYKKLAQELEECIYNGYEPTSVDVVVQYDCIEVLPRHGDTLSCMEDIVDFCRVKRLGEYCFIREYNGDKVVACRIH